MAYIRKTYDVWEIHTNYGYGWECEVTETTYKAAKEQAKCYSKNIKGAVKIVKRRVKK